MRRQNRRPDGLDNDALWYKDAVIYELHVRAFSDSDGDGAGDFRGLTDKLGYLQDLGVTAVWLLPFFPSPWRDDGYDIADYTNVHSAYGTLRDFQTFLKEAHRRGLRVITELVLNHTSDQHHWFQRARKARPGSRERDFYVWSDAPAKYRDARIIFKDFESSNWSWDPVAQSYYWHRFYGHQPDLNFDSPHVRDAMLQTVDFWLDMGVDGLRLDAVPYLYEREGTNCENLPETHAFLRELRAHVDAKYSNRMLLAEANQWPEDAVAYFGEADECHMAFHFPVMPRLFMAYRREDRFPVVDILQLTPPIPESCQWALFLRNHDELTLEMVTDEERDYMYRTYAQDPQTRINLGIRRRLAPLLGNHRRRIELMNALLFSLPGTPVIYYGDEIGMGDNIYLGDRNGVRTPMQWNVDRNAGFSRANPQKLYLPVIIDPEYHYEAVNVESQQNNPHSLLWWMKRLIGLRKQSKALSRGAIEFLQPENHRVLAFLRRHGDETALVVANLSRFVQPVELDLSPFNGMLPVEMFGRVEFPPIGDLPYFLTLAPHTFYWFSIESARAEQPSLSSEAGGEALPAVTVGALEEVMKGKARDSLAHALPPYLKRSRWFRGKARVIRSARIIEAVPLAQGSSWITLVRVDYTEGEPEIYLVPITLASGESAGRILRESARAVMARVEREDRLAGILYSAVHDAPTCRLLLDAVQRRRRFRGEAGELFMMPTRALRQLRGAGGTSLEPALQKAEQSNTSVIYGDHFILKLYRLLEGGVNPDLEIGRFLTEKTSFRHIPRVAGYIEYRPNQGEVVTLGVLQEFVSNTGDAWRHTLDELSYYFETAMAQGFNGKAPPVLGRHPLDLVDGDLPVPSGNFIHASCADATLIGERTAEMHLALAGETDDPDFTPEPFSDFYRQSLYHGILGMANRSLLLLRQQLPSLPADALEEAREVLQREDEIRNRLRAIRDRKISAMRFRHHGDYHLGQVLCTGKDVLIIDFEGEPARPLSERRIKRSPLRDVAGMMRSYHYASQAALHGQVSGVTPLPEVVPALQAWADFWYLWICTAFLRSYLQKAGQAPFLPPTRDELRTLVDAFLLEKAAYEIGYELNNRPDWVRIPLRGILSLLENGEQKTVDPAGAKG
jgi:maltose alpha-D-glucosyltransferase/alpha-amylase